VAKGVKAGNAVEHDGCLYVAVLAGELLWELRMVE
jgi:hypothetical protein